MGRNQQNTSEGVINRIVEDTTIVGEIKCSSNIRIDGKLEGSVSTTGKLVLGASGAVTGDIMCANAEVEGKVIGKLTVKQLLSLKATAKIEGDIHTDKISIEPGAVFTGTCSMGKVKDMNQSSAFEERKLQEQAI